jgi:hypothetical protein
MTGQIPDTINLGGTTYSITAVDGEGLFKPDEHGLQPRVLSTACWRGFVCSYAVQDDRLLLDTLEIGLEPDHPRVSLHGKTPRMAGRRQHHPGAAIYRRLAMPISFTGRLLLADELDLYTHMGFQPAWHYEKVVELVVADGRVVRQADRSAQAATLRRRLRDDMTELDHPRRLLDPQPSEGELEGWVADTFSLGYPYSWPDR